MLEADCKCPKECYCDASHNVSSLHVEKKGTEKTPININDHSGAGRGVWLNTISLLFINAAWFIIAFFVLEKQFQVFGQCCPYIYVTSEWVNIRAHQGKGLGKYKLQRKTHELKERPSNLMHPSVLRWGGGWALP